MPAVERRELRRAQRAGDRRERIAEVLTAVVGLSREISTARPPFAGRQLSRRHVDLLYVLAHHPGPVTPSRMASVLGVTAGAVTQLVDTMEGQGLLRREPHPADARCRVLRLTAGAEAEIAAFEQDIVESMTPRFEALSEVELGSLADLLRRLSPQ